MDLIDIADAWDDVRRTRSRRAKTDRLAAVLRRLEPHERVAGTAMLAGEPRQGRIGVGWATMRDVDVPPAADPSLSVSEVDATLERIAGITGSGSQARRRAELEQLFARATHNEQAYLRGLLLGELRQGALEGVVLDAVATAAAVPTDAVRRAAMLSGNLAGATVTAMTEGLAGLARYRLQVGRPLQPMLAQSADTVAAALQRTGPARIETKLDGMRIQVHRDGHDVAVFTRSLREVTAELPTVVAVVRDLPIRAAVLDGEALALRPDGRPLPFQETMQAIKDAPMRPFLFDVLHVDGDDLLDEPLEERAATLDGFAAPLMVPAVTTPDVGAAEAHLRAALERGHEGVVIKALDAPYEAGRRGSAWIKVKVAHTLDLVVLAAEWGSGRRRGWLSNLHLGALDEEHGDFAMLGKTFKGLTDELLEWQTRELLARETRRDGHVVHVRPELVVEIAFDGVQTSRRYPAGMALRFARVKRYRPDKSAAQADTVATVRAIHRGEQSPLP